MLRSPPTAVPHPRRVNALRGLHLHAFRSSHRPALAPHLEPGAAMDRIELKTGVVLPEAPRTPTEEKQEKSDEKQPAQGVESKQGS